jgi:DNA invertase Pin-like site-specific DNA recombinase
MERRARQGWAFVALDLGVDTSTAAGELVASVMVNVAQWERRAIGERTRAALAARRAAGVQLGRPRTLPDKVRHRIVQSRERGDTYRAIAARLNGEGVPTAQGGAQWHAATVRKVALSHAA